LVTLHREENVTHKENLENIVSALNEISKTNKVILSVHPKLEEMIKKFNIKFEKNIVLNKPF